MCCASSAAYVGHAGVVAAVRNVLGGRDDASMTDIRSAASAAHIDDFIEALPLGYDTKLGDNVLGDRHVEERGVLRHYGCMVAEMVHVEIVEGATISATIQP
jgi:hypothetical protein